MSKPIPQAWPGVGVFDIGQVSVSLESQTNQAPNLHRFDMSIFGQGPKTYLWAQKHNALGPLFHLRQKVKPAIRHLVMTA